MGGLWGWGWRFWGQAGTAICDLWLAAVSASGFGVTPARFAH
jgi:hypothetical protein